MDDTGPTDAEKRDRWERVLSTETEQEFREFVLDRVPLQPDDDVLSVGCGPGFEPAALARRLGPDGTITGVDVNEEVLAAAKDRCEDLPQVSFERGDVTDLPAADETYNLAVAKQVLSAVDDVASAFNELYRVLEPGGRVAITAGDRRTHVKHTPTERLERADEVYRAELGERQLGTRLVSLLPAAGFAVEDVVPRAKLQTEIDDQIENGIDVQRRLLEASDRFDPGEIEAWERDLRALDADDQFLSCSIAFLYVARKPE
ncbi:hypothetical protein BRC82_00220 [Halobacteriales archaeon QS_1_67_19]|nr:MAG: hypothetical protein BRC82_00220 [Halobacteriales archaeon QS_1_67_19]